MEMNTFLDAPPDPAPRERREKPPHVFEERDFADHRQVYVGIHMPIKNVPAQHTRRPSTNSKLKNSRQQLVAKLQRRKHLESKGKPTDDSNTEDEGSVLPAAERVKFILGAVDESVEADKHELFTELEEFFVYDDGNEEWKEIARWFKYEEDVEEGGDRWSKPHVATVSLYSVFELRSSLMSGTVILDLEANSLGQIADLVLDHLVSCNKLEEVNRSRVRDTLLRRHRHQRPAGLRRGLSNIISGSRKSFSTLPAHSNGSVQGRRVSAPVISGHPGSRTSLSVNENGMTTPQNRDSPVPDNQDRKLPRQYSLPQSASSATLARNDSVQGHLVYQRQDTTDQDDVSDKVQGFMKKLPANAEASNVLVGEVDFLEKPITVFIRLQTAGILGDLTEVPIPSRFLFLMMGPSCNPGRYREVGRAISTLMADEVFHDVAYKAKSRDDLIAGIDEFLEQVTILPPGEWDPSIRIEPPLQTPTKESRRPVAKDNKKLQEKNLPGSGNNSGSENGDSKDDINIHYWTRRKNVFGGLELDFINWRARTKDIRDAFHFQCLGSVLFMYLTYLAVIASLGQCLKAVSGNNLGEREQLLSVLIVGGVFSIFGGQPLVLLGTTLPSIIYEKLLFKVCSSTSIDYLPFRMWIGLWAALLLFMFVAFDVSILIRYFTRFSLETFLVLVGITLMYEGFHNLYGLQEKYPVTSGYFQNESCQCLKDVKTFYNLSSTNTSHLTAANGTSAVLYKVTKQVLDVKFRDCENSGGYLNGFGCSDNVYFFAVILTLSSVVLVLFLASFRITGFFPRHFRYIVGDFATMITVAIMSGIALCYEVNIPFISLPTSYRLDTTQRTTWLVPALGSSTAWIIVLAFIPSIPLTMVLFLEQQLTGLFANKRENKLQKPFGYHLDLILIAIGVVLASVLGLPFLAGSIFFTSNHIQSLYVDSSEHARLRFKGVREQRLTSLLSVVMVGLTPLFMPVLKYVPVPVLFGILIYAAVRMLHNAQFVERVKVMLMPTETQPDLIYLRQVPTLSVHIFTMIQLACLVVLWVARATYAAIFFPFLVILLVLVRVLVEFIFPERDLMFLDEKLPRPIWLRRSKTAVDEALMVEEVDGADSQGKTNENCMDEEDSVLLDVRNGSHHPFCLSEELRKTAVWQQVIKEENSSSCNRDSPVAEGNQNQRKRRRKQCKPRHTKGEKSGSNGKSLDRSPKERKLKKTSSIDKEKIKQTKKEEVAPPPPWEEPYQSPPRTDMRLLDIPEFEVHVDPACSRSGSKTPSSCEASEHSSS